MGLYRPGESVPSMCLRIYLSQKPKTDSVLDKCVMGRIWSAGLKGLTDSQQFFLLSGFGGGGFAFLGEADSRHPKSRLLKLGFYQLIKIRYWSVFGLATSS